jgi:hypothetical protein
LFWPMDREYRLVSTSFSWIRDFDDMITRFRDDRKAFEKWSKTDWVNRTGRRREGECGWLRKEWRRM